MLTLQDLEKFVAEEEDNRAKFLFKPGDSLSDELSSDGLTPEEASIDLYDRSKHFAMGFFGSKEWLFGGFKETQPLTYETLLGASPLYLLFIKNLIVNATYMRWFMEVGGRLVEVRLQNVWETRDELSLPLETHRDYENNVSELGHILALAYSTYCKGFNIPNSFLPFDRTGELPVLWEQIYIPMLRSKGIDDPENCPPKKIRSLLKKEFKYLYEIFPYLQAEHNKDAKFETGASRSLRLFLETRKDPSQIEGDHIIMQTPGNKNQIIRDTNDDPVFYRIKNHNWLNLERLRNPSSAVDQYVAHKLKNEPDAFNFDRHCQAI